MSQPQSQAPTQSSDVGMEEDEAQLWRSVQPDSIDRFFSQLASGDEMEVDETSVTDAREAQRADFAGDDEDSDLAYWSKVDNPFAS